MGRPAPSLARRLWRQATGAAQDLGTVLVVARLDPDELDVPEELLAELRRDIARARLGAGGLLLGCSSLGEWLVGELPTGLRALGATLQVLGAALVLQALWWLLRPSER